MVLSFKPQFVKPILAGTKIHTIREDKTDRWYDGRVAQMATGVRTKEYNQFAEKKIISVQRIFMTWDVHFEISIGDQYLYYKEKCELSFNDGFVSMDAFENWFYPIIKSNHGQCFSGKIIHWTDYRY
jgi:hypothetical protein